MKFSSRKAAMTRFENDKELGLYEHTKEFLCIK